MKAHLPTRRISIVGWSYEGEQLKLSLAISQKLYVCPSCREPIGVGEEHIFVAYPEADAPFDHEHWHSRCVQNRLFRTLEKTQPVPARRRPKPRRRGRR